MDLKSEMLGNYEEIQGAIKDLKIGSWFLMSGPGPVLSIVAAYLLFVMKLGPWIMKDRKPYRLQEILVLYNLVQVVLSVYLCAMVSPHTRVTIRPGLKKNISRDTVYLALSSPTYGDRTVGIAHLRADVIELFSSESSCTDRAAATCWCLEDPLNLCSNYLTNPPVPLIIRFSAQVFFVLRKKQSQVTFLHVYHHTITATSSWAYLKYIPVLLPQLSHVLQHPHSSFLYYLMYSPYPQSFPDNVIPYLGDFM
uniref:Elongation of very long chain fatty acids protein n=1 Tax=Timema cristinae TaxID=61476 RepID=A0A7R9DH10_TIMCR|nr:unnamed protein product [Timema cristinae]